jgi:hypothetical protein
MDVTILGSMSGVDLVQCLRKELPNFQVRLVTGYSDVAREAVEEGSEIVEARPAAHAPGRRGRTPTGAQGCASSRRRAHRARNWRLHRDPVTLTLARKRPCRQLLKRRASKGSTSRASTSLSSDVARGAARQALARQVQSTWERGRSPFRGLAPRDQHRPRRGGLRWTG